MVTANIRESRTGDLDEPRAHRNLQARAETYEQAKDLIREQLPVGWIICSYRVDSDPGERG